jgi:hypothetical protein
MSNNTQPFGNPINSGDEVARLFVQLNLSLVSIDQAEYFVVGEHMGRLTTALNQLRQERIRVQTELQQLDQAIQALGKVASGHSGAQAGKIHRMSVAARKRIAAAQRVRWARYHASRKKTA